MFFTLQEYNPQLILTARGSRKTDAWSYWVTPNDKKNLTMTPHINVSMLSSKFYFTPGQLNVSQFTHA